MSVLVCESALAELYSDGSIVLKEDVVASPSHRVVLFDFPAVDGFEADIYLCADMEEGDVITLLDLFWMSSVENQKLFGSPYYFLQWIMKYYYGEYL